MNSLRRAIGAPPPSMREAILRPPLRGGMAAKLPGGEPFLVILHIFVVRNSYFLTFLPQIFFTAAKPFSAAANVFSMSASVCAPLMKIVSNCDGAR